MLKFSAFVLATAAAAPAARSLFRAVDFDNDGFVSLAEMEAVRDVALADHCAEGCASVTDAALGIRALDSSGDGLVSYAELESIFPDPVDPADTYPQQIHISLGQSDDAMSVAWLTRDKCESNPHVSFGAASGAYEQTAAASTFTYEVQMPRIMGTWSGWLHQANVTGLSPSQEVFYTVGSDDCDTSIEFSFTSKAASSKDRRTVLATAGDMGTFMPAGHRVLQQVGALHDEDPLDALVLVGDIAYAGTATNIKIIGVTSDDEDENLWDAMMQILQPVAARLPVLSTVGNHESFYNYTSYVSRFDNPGTDVSGSPFYWSADVGNIHYTSFSTEHDFSEGSPQRAWLEADLKAADANRETVPWVVISGHRPFYSSDKSEYSQHEPGAWQVTELEQLLLDTHVDLSLAGHMHCREVAHPNVNGTVVTLPTGADNVYTDPAAPVYVTEGTGGIFQFESWVNPAPEWSANRMMQFGVGKVVAENSTHLHYDFLNTFPEDDPRETAEFWIVKS